MASSLVRLTVGVVLMVGRPGASASVDWPHLSFTPVVTNAFVRPTGIIHAGDGSDRLFIVEQIGRVWIIDSAGMRELPFLGIADRVLSDGSEQGLLSLVFSPGFATNGHLFANYTRKPDGATVISRFDRSTDPNLADASSESVILIIPQPSALHNGGQLAFGPDGYLYIGMGDGGPQGDPQNRAQSPLSLFGKILRIDVEGEVLPYGIPENNPFVGQNGHAPEIWSRGLRNPWRFSFDRLTGDLFIADVGLSRFEEVNFQPADSQGGENYGWRIREGITNYIVPSGFTNFAGLTEPVAWYNHFSLPSSPSGSITGGYIYRGPAELRMDGVYFFADFMAGWIWGLKRLGTNWQSTSLLSPTSGQHYWISTFGEDEQGHLYMGDYVAGRIYQVVDSGQVWPPTFYPASGTIFSNQVLVSCLTPEASIHFTTNGVDPVPSDPVIASGQLLHVTFGTTNKARAFRADLQPSTVTQAIYTTRVAAPMFSPGPGSVTNGTLVSINTITPGATIYYTTNGAGPTTNNALIYSGPLRIDRSLMIRAFGAAPGYSNSSVTSAAFSLAQVATPAFSPPAGPITNGTWISISCPTPGNKIYFTTNGVAPTTNSSLYTTSFLVEGDTTVRAMAIFPGYLNSAIRTVFFDRVRAEMPRFFPDSGPLESGTPIVMSVETAAATIRYTVDGSDPDTNSLVYSGPLMFSGPLELRARAFRSDLNPSDPIISYFGLRDIQSTVVTTVAGGVTAGFSNGIAALATFSQPVSICFASDGSFLVADSGNHAVRIVSADGQVTTLAGSGTPGETLGPVSQAQFSWPSGVAVDPFGNVFVADRNNCNRVCRIDTNGIVSLLAYTYGDCAKIPLLWQMETDDAGNVYVGTGASVHRISTGGVATLVAGPDWCCPPGWDVQVGVALDSATNIYSVTSGFVLENDAQRGRRGLCRRDVWLLRRATAVGPVSGPPRCHF